MASQTTASGFNPYDQEFTLVLPDGHSKATFLLSDVDYLQKLSVQTAIIYGIQIGVCALLLVVLCLLTKPEKRRSVVFVCNVSALVFLLIRGILFANTLTGPLYNFYNWANGWYINIDSALGQSVAAEVFSCLSIAATELSMLAQTLIISQTIKSGLRHLITCGCLLVATATIAVRFACMIVNIRWGILEVDDSNTAHQNMISALSSGFNIATMISIIFYSSIFCAKLGHAIYQRRKMGMKQFGPMQIVFVMGAQTLVVPVIFGIVSYWALSKSQLYSFMPVVVAVFLPLSAIWASTSTSGNVNIAAPKQWQQRRTATSESTGTSNEKKLLDTAGTDTLVADGRAESFSGASPQKHGHHATAERDSIDLEMAKMGHSISIKHSYSVRTD